MAWRRDLLCVSSAARGDIAPRVLAVGPRNASQRDAAWCGKGRPRTACARAVSVRAAGSRCCKCSISSGRAAIRSQERVAPRARWESASAPMRGAARQARWGRHAWRARPRRRGRRRGAGWRQWRCHQAPLSSPSSYPGLLTRRARRAEDRDRRSEIAQRLAGAFKPKGYLSLYGLRQRPPLQGFEVNTLNPIVASRLVIGHAA